MEISGLVLDWTCESQAVEAGIDLGIKAQATLSDGAAYGNIHVERRFRRRLARARRNSARKRKGSRCRRKARMKLAKACCRMSCRRLDDIHKFTADARRHYPAARLEGLHVSGMPANHHLAEPVSDASFYEIRRQFEYNGREVRHADRSAPAGKDCPACGHVQETPLSERTCRRTCGSELNRDINAAISIPRRAAPKVKPVDCAKRRNVKLGREKNTGL
ncbi:MAG: transposase [Clostridiales bacterium]|nr:transposase [Clostridiales bacterium]